MTEERLCVINIIIEDRTSTEKVNKILSDFGDKISGRMGLPFKEKGIYVITVIALAETKLINAISGKLGMLSGVSAKTLMR